jgi:phthiocerol/phenolphthiocerol synthesis type-I polyketide synthase A
MGVQLALTALWRSYGVQPDAVIGHSMGEVTAAVVAGALSPADGLKVIAIRSRVMSRLAGQGAVGLLELDADATADLLTDHPDVSVAGIISPRQTVVAGPVGAVDAVIAAVSAQDRFARRVNMEVASHTDLMDPILPELGAALADLNPAPPKIPFFSTVKDGDTVPRLDGQYWVDNVRQPVLFSKAITAAAEHHSTFIEISPHPTLAHAITETLEATPHADRVLVAPTMKRDADETLFFHTQLAPLAIASPERSGNRRVADMPPSPWLHTWHWIAIDNSSRQTRSTPRPGTLIGQHTPVASTPPSHMWQALLSPESKPYPFSHRIDGAEVVPISVLLQTLSVAAAVVDASLLSEVRFDSPIPVDHPRVIQVVADNEAVTVSSRSDADSAPQRWVRHCSARISREAPSGEPERPEVRRNGRRHEPPSADVASFADLHKHLMTDGGSFPWAISSLEAAPDGLHVDVEVSEPSAVAVIDAAVHIARLAGNSNAQHLVPASAESVGFTGEFVDTHCSIEVRRRDGSDGPLSDVAVRSSDGSARIDIRGLRFATVGSGPGSTAAGAEDPRTLAHTLEWQRWSVPADSSPAFDTPPTIAVIGAESIATGIRNGLAEVGYLGADVDSAQCVVFVADPGAAAAGETDTECAVRLTKEVADLVRRLAQRSDDRPTTLWVITRGVRESASDGAVRLSSLWGLAGVIRAEQPDLWGGLIDLPSEGEAGDWVPAISTALRTPAKSILALRDGELLCQEVTPLSGPPVHEPLRCRPDAAYLITGGMGALGLLMADWLADRGARRLILVGRTPLPPRREWDSAANDADVRQKVAAIRALEMRGVAVEAMALDIGSRDGLQAMLSRRDELGYPPVRGVIHSAGLNDGQLLTEIEDRRLRSTMWPKISGARTLHEVFPPGSLDFMYLTSAAGAVFGVPGQAAYASANAYLDGLARSRHRQGCHTVSLDWVAWRGLGFATEAQVVLDELDRVGSRPITPAEAFPAWEFVHTHDVAQAVMAPMPSGQSDDAVSAPARAWSEMALEDLLVELEAELTTILSGNLLIAEADIDPTLPFAEMGLNSVMAMSIRRDAERLLGIELSATMLWNHPTISSLAAFLAKKVRPQEYAHDHGDLPFESASNVLDDLFASVESAAAGSEGAT